MRERNVDRPEMTWEVGDAMDLQWPDNTFDLVLDKGTLDAILHSDDAFVNVAHLTKEFQRVTKIGGTVMIISYGLPPSRAPHLQREHLNWNLITTEIIDSKSLSENYIYIA